MKKLFLLMLALSCQFLAFADVVKGIVVDAETGEPLGGVSVDLNIKDMRGSSSSFGFETDSTGRFECMAGMEGRMMLSFSMIGYHKRRVLSFNSGRNPNDTVFIDTVRLEPTALMMKEVEVNARMPRVTMSGDTIVFHPEAFKLPEGARLSELIRKLPGVQRRDGQLYWNGKPLRLMMNGRNIFGGDGMINELPAEVAGKIKLYDHKSELARHTGRDDGEEDNVLDIQVKPGFLDKWYGNLEGNYATGGRYMGQLRASRLSDHDPVMVFGQLNNENDRVEAGSNWMSWGSISDFGRQQYGSASYQHNWQPEGTKKFSESNVWVTPTMSHVDGWSNSHGERETFMDGQEHTWTTSDSWDHSHEINPKLSTGIRVYLDSLNMLDVNASGGYTKRRTASGFATASGSRTVGDIISRQDYHDSGDEENGSLNALYNWTHYLGHMGNFVIGGSTYYNGGTSHSYSNQQIDYLRADSTLQLFQYDRTPTTSLTTSLGPSVSLWLGKRLYVKLSYNAAYTLLRTSRHFYADTSEALLTDGVPTTEDEANRERNHQHNWQQDVSASADIKLTEGLSLSPQLTWRWLRERADYQYGSLDTAAVRYTTAWLPRATVKWKIDRLRHMELSFNYNTDNPDLVSTFDYLDTRDPQNIMSGNSHQHRSHSYDVNYSFTRLWMRQQTVLQVSAQYHRDINPFSSLITYNTLTAAYRSVPMNVRGGDNYRFSINMDKGLGFYWRVVNNASFNWAKRYGYLTRATIDEQPRLNRQRSFDFNDNFELGFETDKVQLQLYDRLALSRYRYSSSINADNTTLFMTYGLNWRFTLWENIDVQGDCRDEFRTGYMGSSTNGHRWICNARINYYMLKKKLRLFVTADDIFNQNRNYSSSYSAYESSESWRDSFHHYLTIGLSYRFDAKGENN